MSPAGLQGVAGKDGKDGAVGPKGEPGVAGAQGLVGPKEQDGAVGPQVPGGVSILGGGPGSANAKMDASKFTCIPIFEGNQDQDEVNELQVVPSGGSLTHF